VRVINLHYPGLTASSRSCACRSTMPPTWSASWPPASASTAAASSPAAEPARAICTSCRSTAGRLPPLGARRAGHRLPLRRRDGSPAADDGQPAAARRRQPDSKTGLRFTPWRSSSFTPSWAQDDRFTGLRRRTTTKRALLHCRALATRSCGSERRHRLHQVLPREVGYIDRLESEDPELDGKRVEQYEVEFDLQPIETWAPGWPWRAG